MHNDLVDSAFKVASGKWVLWCCTDCTCAYLDPRPSIETIGAAYASYYTHQAPKERPQIVRKWGAKAIRRALANGYTNWKYATTLFPASHLGIIAALAIPTLRRILDRKYRHIPKPPTKNAKLLDVGCGDGTFVRLAQSCGWDAIGVDPDHKAVANAAQHGTKVFQGGIETFDGESAVFDAITLSHVIEHVHDPVNVLHSCLLLLKPGGQIWLETPNIQSFGHKIYGEHWRGLEPPRHLVLFSPTALKSAMMQAGYQGVQFQKTSNRAKEMFAKSAAIEKNSKDKNQATAARRPIWLGTLANLAAEFFHSKREFLTIVGYKSL